ncbi:PDF receptor isoform X1 [Fopius arisanus]|uniref:PDF receptor isoform X1 n=2 Tax=Fopius arisanus TaxID=64838 RepID=A0A9R1U517_9HYME|nr:PREDICTED: PDF receptor isoform X1 [Fopius arisanus]XP_011307317.1 PREDICTED: PDF receptor isoform X1 [Fopius arisanus]XP_011307325.1 PREDICTED: PDF receptor isoform X1 [Fopius arisanus]
MMGDLVSSNNNSEASRGRHNNTETGCNLKYQDFVVPDGEIWCEYIWDGFLCWAPVKTSTTSLQRCPPTFVVDEFAERRCSEEGKWGGRSGAPEEPDFPNGWTNYTLCYSPEMRLLLRKLHTGDKAAAQVKLAIAEKTRTLEFVGLSISLAALLISLAIFCRFRSLRNTRTRIHKNLFVAMVIQVVIRLTLYIDQAFVKADVFGSEQGINNTPVLCEASYVLLEYARTAMFMWMFIEGFFLHNMVTVTVFHETSYYRMYRLVGWGFPAVMTFAWAIVTAFYYHSFKCWWGYNLSVYFWILEGPRMAVILLNFLFLMNIVRVLVVKLRQSHTSETEQVRKAVRAAVVLLPLLGITNLISMAGVPLEQTMWFALWSYTTHFLTSFQGVFIAILYCFLNGEVRLALNKTMSLYVSLRAAERHSRRQSTFSACQPQRIASVVEMEPRELRPSGWLRFCCRGRDTPPPDQPAETTV